MSSPLATELWPRCGLATGGHRASRRAPRQQPGSVEHGTGAHTLTEMLGRSVARHGAQRVLAALVKAKRAVVHAKFTDVRDSLYQ